MSQVCKAIIIILQAEAILTFKKFIQAVREGTWGEDISYNSFDEKLWDELFKRIKFDCEQAGLLKQLRPALNIGTQYQYLAEKKKERGFWTEEDYEDVYPQCVIGGDGRIKTDPIHIFVPEIMSSTMDQMSMDAFTCSGIKGYLEMMLPPYTSSDPTLRRAQGITLLAATGLHSYRHVVNQASKECLVNWLQ